MSIRLMFIACPSQGTAAAARPVREPCTVTGIFFSYISFKMLETSSVVRGKEILSAFPTLRDSSRRYSSYSPLIGRINAFAM